MFQCSPPRKLWHPEVPGSCNMRGVNNHYSFFMTGKRVTWMIVGTLANILRKPGERRLTSSSLSIQHSSSGLYRWNEKQRSACLYYAVLVSLQPCAQPSPATKYMSLPNRAIRLGIRSHLPGGACECLCHALHSDILTSASSEMWVIIIAASVPASWPWFVNMMSNIQRAVQRILSGSWRSRHKEAASLERDYSSPSTEPSRVESNREHWEMPLRKSSLSKGSRLTSEEIGACSPRSYS